jgi:hypothetical protein
MQGVAGAGDIDSMHNFDAFEENYPAEALGSEVCDEDGTGRRERMISSSERSASRPELPSMPRLRFWSA